MNASPSIPPSGRSLLSPAATASGRLLSLDVYRGLTIAAMILVTDPGTYSATYAQLRHAEWTGATATDMIFPSFLFIAGAAIPFAMAAPSAQGRTPNQLALRILRRCLLLMVIGLLLNAFPHFDWSHLRLPGILQRIAVCYSASALVYLYLLPQEMPSLSALGRSAAVLGALLAVSLGGYWALLLMAPVPGVGAGHLDSYGNFPSYIDRAVFGINHLWAYGLTPGRGVTYDSEGILSTVPAWTATLLGLIAGIGLRTPAKPLMKTLMLLSAGSLLTALGLALTPWMPLNKRIYTPTFALFSGGVSLLLFGVFYWLVDVRKSRWWTLPARIFGTNAILAFTFSTLLTSSLSAWRIHKPNGSQTGAYTWIYEHCFTGWIAPVNGSLSYACAIVLVNLALLYPFYRRRLFLRL